MFRPSHSLRIRNLLARRPVVALLGARQVGKTTLARSIAKEFGETTTFFDLDDRRDRARLVDPTLALEPLTGLVVIDEIQQFPELFSVLRVLADRPGCPARFLVLGSASPDLIRHGSQSLAGRIGFHELRGFDLGEVGDEALDRLWLRGGFPLSFLADTDEDSASWRRDFIRTFLERDLPRMGFGIPPETMSRFWSMLAHYHAQTWNASELARSFGVAHTTVRRHLDLLTGTFVVRQLPAWHENAGKRVVRAPKVFIRDSGLLHTLLDLSTRDQLERHPKLGASWEGFLVEEIIQAIGARQEQCFFWATYAGAEIDLIVIAGNRRLGFECKRTDAPRVTQSLRKARESLRLDEVYLVHAGNATFPLPDGVQAVAASRLRQDLPKLSDGNPPSS